LSPGLDFRYTLEANSYSKNQEHHIMIIRLAIFAFTVVASFSPLLAQSSSKRNSADDWPTFNRDLAGTRFSPLNQINAANVSQLKLAWSFRAADMGGAAPSQATPLVIRGVMYVPTGNGVVALEPETGKTLWTYKLPEGLTASYRGVAFWPGDGQNEPRILFTAASKEGPAAGPQSVARYKTQFALSARTGKLSPGFGKEGIVELDVAYAGVPTIFKNVVMIGAYGQEHAPLGISGDTRAFDARTGAKLWDFHSVPRPGEVGNDTWAGDSWKDRSGTNAWTFQMTMDEARGILYMPIGAPSSTYYGGDRKGANLFGNSLVAIDAQTGKYKWHFQTIHHDIWDYDLPPSPGLVDVVKDGKKIPALAQIGKTGLMYILDRVTGKPIFGVEERPVPKSDAPGEETWPTQPFPVKPPALARNSFKPEDLVTAADTTPEHAQACRDLVEKAGGLVNLGPFTPWAYRAEGGPARSTVSFPGVTGGTNWGGTATDPRTGYVYTFTQDIGAVGAIEKFPEGHRVAYVNEAVRLQYDSSGEPGTPGSPIRFEAPATGPDGKPVSGKTWPCQRPPWGRLSAVNANTGEVAWQVTVGVTDELPEGKRNTGRTGNAGPMVTAGGLVFMGATSDGRFRAFDATTGKQLWETTFEYSASAIPITFRGKNGKQYVAIMAAGTPMNGATEGHQGLMVFALP
jgi:quinoprotein glucose dehydrogenase